MEMSILGWKWYPLFLCILTPVWWALILRVHTLVLREQQVPCHLQHSSMSASPRRKSILESHQSLLPWEWVVLTIFIYNDTIVSFCLLTSSIMLDSVIRTYTVSDFWVVRDFSDRTHKKDGSGTCSEFELMSYDLNSLKNPPSHKFFLMYLISY